MILDTLAHAERYFSLHPNFAAAFQQLHRTDLASLAPGKHSIDGDQLFLIIDQQDGRGRAGARLEAHRKFIDIQFTISGQEEIGWKPLADCQHSTAPYSSEQDVELFNDVPDTWALLPDKHFVILFPQDAHAPLAGSGPLHKAVLKVAVNG